MISPPPSFGAIDRGLWAARRALLELGDARRRGGLVRIGPARPEVALTFDDGPDPRYTPAILDVLKARGARATFFLLGRHVEAFPSLARRVAAEHEVGCHSFDHARGLTRSLSTFRDDAARCRVAFERELGLVPRLYRFPWGDAGAVEPSDVLALEGMRCIGWTGSSGDDTLEPRGIVARIARYVAPGSILLLHDGVAPGSVRRSTRDATVTALPAILDLVAARGLRAVSVGELLCDSRFR